MAFKAGRTAGLLFNEFRLTPYLDSAAMSVSIGTGDTSTFGTDWTTAIPTLNSATFSMTGRYDEAALPANVRATLGNDAGILTYIPADATSIGALARLSSVASTNLATSSPVGDVVAVAWDAMSEAPVQFGVLLHPYGADTDTTTGASYDGSAASSTGWTAHLHVGAVSAGSWVVTIEDSSTGSSGWAAIATFTAATGATSQRLQSAATTTTVKQSVRYVATRTGGSASASITFALAFARQSAP